MLFFPNPTLCATIYPGIKILLIQFRAINSFACNIHISMNLYCFAVGSCLCSRGASRSLPREMRRTEEVQEQVEQRPALGRQQPEPPPARENTPPAGSAKPRKNRRKKTNVLFCNIQRVCECVCFVHLLICEKGDSICFSRDWTYNAQTRLDNKQGKTFEERRDKTNGGFAVSQTTGACYPLSSVEPGHQRKGHKNNNNNNYPLSFIESAKLCYKLNSALYL